jgi:methylmalonyl-CoA mutase C-terminal domain/subunit
MIADAAVQEDVDAIGLSILSGAHLTLFPAVLGELRARGAHDVVLFGGGIISGEHGEELRRAGVAELFTPGASTQEIVAWVRAHVRPRTL